MGTTIGRSTAAAGIFMGEIGIRQTVACPPFLSSYAQEGTLVWAERERSLPSFSSSHFPGTPIDRVLGGMIGSSWGDMGGKPGTCKKDIGTGKEEGGEERRKNKFLRLRLCCRLQTHSLSLFLFNGREEESVGRRRRRGGCSS